METTNTTKYDLTEAQIRYVKSIQSQTQELERNLRSFLNYVLDEAKLPPVEGGYMLSSDGASIVPNPPPQPPPKPSEGEVGNSINTSDSTTR